MWQFSLRTLMGVTFAILVFTWVFGVLPGFVGGLLLIGVNALVPAATITGIIYLPDNYRAFFVGVAPSAAICFLLTAIVFIDDGLRDLFRLADNDDIEARLMLCLPLAVMFVSGWVGVGMRVWGLRLKQATAPANANAAAEAVTAVPASMV